MQQHRQANSNMCPLKNGKSFSGMAKGMRHDFCLRNCGRGTSLYLWPQRAIVSEAGLTQVGASAGEVAE